MTEQPVREDGYPGSTIGSPVNNTDNKLVVSGHVLCSGLITAAGCLVYTHPARGCLFMQDTGDFMKTENQEEVVRPSRLPPGWTIAECPLGQEVLDINHLHSATRASVSVR